MNVAVPTNNEDDNMPHPLDFISNEKRKPLFLSFLFLTLILFAVFRVLDAPLRTLDAPNGIVSFELARTPEQARIVLSSWDEHYNPVLGYAVTEFYTAPLYAAFGLGLDYLFMPAYALALSLGILLAASRHAGWFARLGAWMGWGALAAALFDAVENFALFKLLLNNIYPPWPAIAYWCATVKFTLLLLGLAYAFAGWVWPKRK